MLTGAEMQLGRGETIADTARVLSRYVDAIMIRTLDHARWSPSSPRHATVPVINGLTQHSHPCQIMADVMTFEEHRGPDRRQDRRLARRRQQRAHLVGPRRRHASASSCGSRRRRSSRRAPALLDWARGERRRRSTVTSDPEAAAARRRLRRHRHLGVDGRRRGASAATISSQPYQVNRRLMALARPDAIFMHCLPAHRGEEVTAEVIDGPQSVVFDEAENRLHAQKGILAWVFGWNPPA